MGFNHGFIASLSVIVVSELGDKTFFIAAIMAMRHARLVVFSGAITALIVQTIISGTKKAIEFTQSFVNQHFHFCQCLAIFGWITVIIPRVYTYYISTLLFAIFGLKMLKEGYSMSPDEGQEEFEEVQSDLKKKDDEVSYSHTNLTKFFPFCCVPD